MRKYLLIWMAILIIVIGNVLILSCDDDDDDDDNDGQVGDDEDDDQDESFGACCVNEQCSVATYNDCGGQWLGPDTACDPPDICENQEDYGACCAYSECTVTTYSDCPSAWQGASTTCYPDPCDSGGDDDTPPGDDDDDDTTQNCCVLGDPCNLGNDGSCDCPSMPWDWTDCHGGDDDDDDDDDDDTTPEGVWTDTTSGLMWQVTPTGGTMNWNAAKSHCQSLNLGGYSNWRMPSISELRSLIRGCGATQTGGSCGVTDSCAQSSCQDWTCEGCDWSGNCHWSPNLDGNCSYYSWSSSVVEDDDSYAWSIIFGYAGIAGHPITDFCDVRCVR